MGRGVATFRIAGQVLVLVMGYCVLEYHNVVGKGVAAFRIAGEVIVLFMAFAILCSRVPQHSR